MGKVVTGAGRSLRREHWVGLDLEPSNLYLYQPEARATLCYRLD